MSRWSDGPVEQHVADAPADYCDDELELVDDDDPELDLPDDLCERDED